MTNNSTQIFNELIKRQPDFLDKPLKELLPMRFMGQVAVNAYQGLIKRLDDLPLAQEEKEAKLKDGQDAGKFLLAIEAKIGKLLPPPEEMRRLFAEKQKGIPRSKLKSAGISILPKNIDSQTAFKAREIARHPEEVEEVIREAEENEDIPTKTAVLNKIAYKREKARKKGTMETTRLEMKANAYLYYTKLEEACRLIPSRPPSDLIEKDYIAIKAIALLIINKLEVFRNGKKDESLSR